MKTCWIIGNGPSYNRVPQNLLESEITFGMNYCAFQPTYYVCVDTDVITKNSEKILPLVQGAQIACLSAYHKDDGISLYDGKNIFLVEQDTNSFKAEQFMSGFTAAYVALKCAYYIGFDDVHLYGIDHSPDWAHYKPEYPSGASDRARRMSVMEFHYQLAANVYARAGRTITNHSNPSKLDAIFKRSS